jgi:hypothetical protein
VVLLGLGSWAQPARELEPVTVFRVPVFVKGTNKMITSSLSPERRAHGVFTAVEQQALLGFRGGYSGLTRDAY